MTNATDSHALALVARALATEATNLAVIAGSVHESGLTGDLRLSVAQIAVRVDGHVDSLRPKFEPDERVPPPEWP